MFAGKWQLVRAGIALSAVTVLALTACGDDDGDDDHDHDGAVSVADAAVDARGDGGADAAAAACAEADPALVLPEGFCASVFARDVGLARHLAVTPSGDVFVAVGPSRDGSDPGEVLALRDADGNGVADQRETVANVGGNGIAWADGQLYVARHAAIVRYPVADGSLVSTAKEPDVIVAGLPITGDHTAKTVVVAGDDLYVNIGSASNSCQVVNRALESPGVDPCPELEVRAGIWRFAAGETDQTQLDGTRFATGVRNGNALALQPGTDQLWALQNGRDQLFENWPELFTAADDQRLPAEELQRVNEGDDFGWPYCFHDPDQDKKVLAPEYGGDGELVGECGLAEAAAAVLPAHWAPLGAVFYTGAQFPARYRDGLFIASHGSRFAPDATGDLPGYNVVFVPFAQGLPAASWENFATGFAGAARPLPEAALHRPVGVAQGPDGALYVSDDHGGTIWKIVYVGDDD